MAGAVREALAGRTARWPRWVAAGLVALLAGLASASEVGAPATFELVRERVDRLAESPRLGGLRLVEPTLIQELYAARGFRPLWTNTASVRTLLETLEAVSSHGLVPGDYAAEELVGRWRELPGRGDVHAEVDRDLLSTASLLRLAYSLRYGKVHPERLHAGWNLRRGLDEPGILGRLLAAVEEGALEAFLVEALPQRPEYALLRGALARYRALEVQGGWAPVPKGPTLRLGDRGPRVAALRARLRVTGDLAGPPPAREDELDAALEAGVMDFQARHGLLADGLVGPRTLAALNVPVAERVAQLRVNLERARWMPREVPPEYLLVDIAGFRVELVRDGVVAFQARAVVGRPYRRTPVFSSQMRYLVLNPDWTVPPTIFRQDLLPRLRRDPDHLAREHMQVVDAAGRPVDAPIDWESVDPARFPYWIRQSPGPWNALGRVKFMFPNPYAVYVHDTPVRGLFARDRRTFSSGCIRVENALELAAVLLEGADWDRAAIDRVLDTGRSRTVNLPRPVPVALLYWTVEMGTDGRVGFREDVYERDAPLLRALEGGFEYRAPEGMPRPAGR